MTRQMHLDTSTAACFQAGPQAGPAPVGGALYWLLFALPGVVLIMDLALTGSGQWSAALGFSVRRLVLALLALYALALWVGTSLRVPHALAGVLGIGVFVLAWSVQIPLLHEVPLASSLDDSQLFLG